LGFTADFIAYGQYGGVGEKKQITSWGWDQLDLPVGTATWQILQILKPVCTHFEYFFGWLGPSKLFIADYQLL
jgi:hypothetical protein